MKYTFEQYVERFWERVDKSGGVDSCWPWLGFVSKAGYAQVRFQGRFQKAHRVAYEFLIGPIPEGKELDHLCKNRSCVNPKHLEPVTKREHIMRGGNFMIDNSHKTHCPQGHPYDAENTIIDNENGGRRCRICRNRQSQMRKWAKRERHMPFTGVDNPRAKLTEDDVRFIRASTLSTRELVKMFPVNRNMIYNIKARLNWSHVI